MASSPMLPLLTLDTPERKADLTTSFLAKEEAVRVIFSPEFWSHAGDAGARPLQCFFRHTAQYDVSSDRLRLPRAHIRPRMHVL